MQVPAVLGALVALSMLLLTGTLTWKDCLDYTPAWDTLLWFSILVSMCNALSASGLVAQFAQLVGTALQER
jgi:DASS family divalent anion:Na+ symporter